MEYRFNLDPVHDKDRLIIRKAIYWLDREFDFDFSFSDVSVIFTIDADVEKDFIKRLLFLYNDFVLREQVRIKTEPIKQLIMAKMFFPDQVELPQNDLDDPIRMMK